VPAGTQAEAKYSSAKRKFDELPADWNRKKMALKLNQNGDD